MGGAQSLWACFLPVPPFYEHLCHASVTRFIQARRCSIHCVLDVYLLMQCKEETVQLCLQHPAAHVDRSIKHLAQTLSRGRRKKTNTHPLWKSLIDCLMSQLLVSCYTNCDWQPFLNHKHILTDRNKKSLYLLTQMIHITKSIINSPLHSCCSPYPPCWWHSARCFSCTETGWQEWV